MSRNDFRSEYQRIEAQRRRRERLATAAGWIASAFLVTVLVITWMRACES